MTAPGVEQHHTWSPAQQQSAATTAALFSHLSHVLCLIVTFPFLGWIPPLCIKLATKDTHARTHAVTALNFVLTQMIVWTSGVAITVALMTLAVGVTDWAVTAVLAGMGLLGLVYLALGATHAILGMIKAGRAESFRYPAYLAFPMVK